MSKTTVLFRPIGSAELRLIEESGYREFPPRLPEQPIFYPVLNEDYAIRIARDWNAKFNTDRIGFVTRFEVRTDYLKRYEVKTVGGSEHQELWVPADELAEFNDNIVGTIQVVATFQGDDEGPSMSNRKSR